MPKCLKYYKSSKKAKAYRSRHRKKNYDKTRNMKNTRNIWSTNEEELLSSFKGSDKELSDILNRGVQAIQIKRWKLKTGYVNK
jgi:hypothetical protein